MLSNLFHGAAREGSKMLKYFDGFPLEDTGVFNNVAFLAGVVSCVLGIALSLLGVWYWWDFFIITGAVIGFSTVSFALGKAIGRDEEKLSETQRREKADPEHSD